MLEIQAVLPNPAGSDREFEYVELINKDENSINISGWKIKDKSGKEYELPVYTLESNQKIRLDSKTTKISLNNSEEEILLINPRGEVVDKLEYYGSVKEGQVILQNAELTEEIKQELFEDLEPIAPENSPFISLEFVLSLVVIGLVLGIMGFLIYKKYENKQFKRI